MRSQLDKIPHLKISKREVVPNGPGFFVFTYLHDLFMVDEGGYEIIKCMNGKMSIRKIVDKIQKQYRIKDKRQFKYDILKFISYLEKKKVVGFYE